MKTQLLVASCGVLSVTAFATADFTGISTQITFPDPTIAVCRVLTNFDDPNDRLLSIGFADFNSPESFYQNPLGLDTAPLDFLIPIDPLVAFDSFVTIGVELNDGTDGSTVDPDFDSMLFNNDGRVVGGWFNSNPDNGQGDPVGGKVLIAQLSLTKGFPQFISGSMVVFWKDGDTGDIIGSTTDFVHIPAPSALSLLALACARRRRRR